LRALFWLFVVGSVFSYLLYKLTLLMLPRRGARPAEAPAQGTPLVTLVIACRNESARLRH